MPFVTQILNYFWNNLSGMLYTVPVLLIAFPVHELSHGLVALLLGDRTAKNAGRLTLNPLRHLDLLGTICLIFFRFGWAKPVPVNPNNFKNRKTGMALTAFAGPMSNLLLAALSMLLIKLLLPVYGLQTTVLYVVLQFLYYSAIINIGLFVFNLIPVPPLDGSRIVMLFLPGRAELFFERYGAFFQLGLLVLLFMGFLDNPLSTMVGNVYNNLARLAGISV